MNATTRRRDGARSSALIFWRRPTLSTAKNAALYLAAWTVFALFFFSWSMTVGGYWFGSVGWGPLLASWLVQAYAWAALTPAVVSIGRRFPIEQPRRVVRGSMHLVLSVLLAALVAALNCAIAPRPGASLGALLRIRSLGELASEVTMGFHQDLMAYWIIFALHYTFAHYGKIEDRRRRTLELEKLTAATHAELIDTELSGLRGHLQPEFVFDTLGTIRALVQRSECDRAEELLVALGDLLRRVLDNAETQVVPLEQELEHVRLYLAVEQLRFANRFDVHISVDPPTLDAAVGYVSLQPLVERILRCMVRETASLASISIRTMLEEESLKIEIECSTRSTWPRLLASDLEDDLEAIRGRLKHVSQSCRLRVATTSESATIVTLLAPFQATHHINPAPRGQALDEEFGHDGA